MNARHTPSPKQKPPHCGYSALPHGVTPLGKQAQDWTSEGENSKRIPHCCPAAHAPSQVGYPEPPSHGGGGGIVVVVTVGGMGVQTLISCRTGVGQKYPGQQSMKKSGRAAQAPRAQHRQSDRQPATAPKSLRQAPAVVAKSVPSHSSPASATPLPHTEKSVVVVVVVVVAVAAVSAATASSTRLSTESSTAPASPLVRHGGLASAFANAAVKRASAFPRHAGSAAPPCFAAFEWQPSFVFAFFPVAFSLAAAQRLASATGRSAATTAPTLEATSPSMAPASPVVAQPPFASALAKASVSLVPALARQPGSAAMPFCAALAWQVTLASAAFAVAFSLAALHTWAGVPSAWPVAASARTVTVTTATVHDSELDMDPPPFRVAADEAWRDEARFVPPYRVCQPKVSTRSAAREERACTVALRCDARRAQVDRFERAGEIAWSPGQRVDARREERLDGIGVRRVAEAARQPGRFTARALGQVRDERVEGALHPRPGVLPRLGLRGLHPEDAHRLPDVHGGIEGQGTRPRRQRRITRRPERGQDAPAGEVVLARVQIGDQRVEDRGSAFLHRHGQQHVDQLGVHRSELQGAVTGRAEQPPAACGRLTP